MAGRESDRSPTPMKVRVFLADDHPLVHEALAALLEKTKEFKVVGRCRDGLQVVPQVAESCPDVVVLDVGMPGASGVDICHDLQLKLPDVVVLMLSMHKGEEFVLAALENGARGYLLSPPI